jgi:holo-[acyl-carrier protein] synthase
VEVGVGTDIVEVRRLASLMDDGGERFAQRWFTHDEIAYCMAKAQPALHLAARLAAKEAVVKALRSPWDGPVPWRDIEVVVGSEGVPRVRLSGHVASVVARLGVPEISISLSHTQEYATATAVYVVP